MEIYIDTANPQDVLSCLSKNGPLPRLIKGVAGMETCAYCGDEIIDGGVTLDVYVFCSQECLESFREESYEYMEEEEFDF